MPNFRFAVLVFSALGAIFQPPAEIHSVELTEWRVDSGGNGHFYEAVQAPAGITWDDAEAYAKAHGGYLATLTSQQENTFVFKLVDDAGFWMVSPHGDSWGPWLGGFKLSNSTRPDAAWIWPNGEGPFTYTNWSPHQPDNDGGNESRLHFYGEGRNNQRPEWDDLTSGEHLQGFVVEYNTNPLPQSLGYVALFAVCLMVVLFLGCLAYLLLRKKDGTENISE